MTDQKKIDAACEAICDQLEDISALQARVMRAIYRDKLSEKETAVLCGVQLYRVHHELQGALANIVNILTGDSLANWATPGHDARPAPGESANAQPVPDIAPDNVEQNQQDTKDNAKSASIKKAKGTRQKRAAGPSQG